MTFLAIIGTVTAIVALCQGQTTTPDPNSNFGSFTIDNTATIACFLSNGLDPYLVYMFLSNMTKADLDQQCLHSQQYSLAWQCVSQKKDVPTASISSQLALGLDALCQDPKVNRQCISDLSHRTQEFDDCLTSFFQAPELVHAEQVLRDCLGFDLAIQCTSQLLHPCDAYTAKVLEDFTKGKLSPPKCAFTSIIG